MRILMAPMATVAETGGSMTRTRALASKALARGHEVAFCAGEDVNYRPLAGIKNYYAPVPSPLGLPFWFGKRAFALAKRLGIQQRTKITNFEQVLYIIGALEKRFFALDVQCLQEAIRKFKPDIVLAEHRIAPLVAARLANVKAATIYSAPIHQSRTGRPHAQYSRGVVDFVAAHELPVITSVLDVYDWAAMKIIPSSPELEPLEGDKLVYVGPLIENLQVKVAQPAKTIVAYMGNGTVSGRKLVAVMEEAMRAHSYTVYIATHDMPAFQRGNIQVAPRFDFDELLGSAVAFVSHGGQNSMMQSLLHGVPLIVCPGAVFERQYNAAALVRLGAGVQIDITDFTPDKLCHVIDSFAKDSGYRTQALAAGARLASLGGALKAVEALESIC